MFFRIDQIKDICKSENRADQKESVQCIINLFAGGCSDPVELIGADDDQNGNINICTFIQISELVENRYPE